MEALLVFIALIAIFVALYIIIDKTIEFAYNTVEAKRKREHPKLFELIENHNQCINDECGFYNKNIHPLKQKVDSILRDWNYYPMDTREEMEIQLEDIRNNIQELSEIYAEKCENSQAVKEEIKAYVAEHNIKWAK